MNSNQENPADAGLAGRTSAQSEKPCDNNTQAKLLEESAKKALALKRKELKWKLMQVSQAENQAKLRETQTAVNYHRQKLSKAQELAARLRKKYVKVVKSAKLTELQLKKAETQLSQQERFVAHEKMQLTKLAFDCINSGTELFGDKYALPENSNNQYRIDIPKRLVSNTKQRSPQTRQQSPQRTKQKEQTIQPEAATGSSDAIKSAAKKRTLKLNMLDKLPPLLIEAQKSKWASGIPSSSGGPKMKGKKQKVKPPPTTS